MGQDQRKSWKSRHLSWQTQAWWSETSSLSSQVQEGSPLSPFSPNLEGTHQHTSTTPILLLPLKYSIPTLLHSIRYHGLSGKQQSWVSRNNSMKAFKRDEGKPMATQQLLAKKDHHGLLVPMHLSSAKALSLGSQNNDSYEVLAPKLKDIRA